MTNPFKREQTEDLKTHDSLNQAAVRLQFSVQVHFNQSSSYYQETPNQSELKDLWQMLVDWSDTQTAQEKCRIMLQSGGLVRSENQVSQHLAKLIKATGNTSARTASFHFSALKPLCCEAVSLPKSPWRNNRNIGYPQ